jgi:hypothetical protein
MSLPSETFFSDNYLSARARWMQACERCGARVDSIALSSHGAEGGSLTLDFAWIGPADAKKVIFHIAGTHGIEGFLGSAIQLAILASLDSPPSDCAYVFLHCLNPWGMSFLRRVTEDNVDLNRNFHGEDFHWSGASSAYRALDSFLNPKRLPCRFDFFYLQSVAAILRYGFAPVKQAVAQGQYEFKQGLFYGGDALTENLTLLSAWARKNLHARELFVIEIHSGLGPFAYDTLLSPLNHTDAHVKELEDRLQHSLSTSDPALSVAFDTAGDLMHGLPPLLPSGKTNWILQEFGTAPILEVLKAFRNENMYYHMGGQDLTHWAKRDLFEAFCPASPAWRRAVLQRGIELFRRATHA